MVPQHFCRPKLRYASCGNPFDPMPKYCELKANDIEKLILTHTDSSTAVVSAVSIHSSYSFMSGNDFKIFAGPSYAMRLVEIHLIQCRNIAS